MQLKSAFMANAPENTLTRDGFRACFGSLLYGLDEDETQRAAFVLDKMFDIFDINGDGHVDVAEFLSGLSVLVGGSRDDKIRAAFDLYDLNENGYISLNEFERYLVSVFTVRIK